MNLPITDIILDEQIYQRHKIDQNRVATFAENIRDGFTFDPIEVQSHPELPDLTKMAELPNSSKADLQRGFTVRQVAEKHDWPEPLIWSLALEEKDDLDRFKQLNWGLRTWDNWEWNDCDKRFGDDWPGRIPAQLIGHLLYYFTKQNDLIFDPPYFDKKAASYDEKSIATLSGREYLHFLESFFILLKEKIKKTTRLAFINADWRDFQHKPAIEEPPEEAIIIDDYLNLL